MRHTAVDRPARQRFRPGRGRPLAEQQRRWLEHAEQLAAGTLLLGAGTTSTFAETSGAANYLDTATLQNLGHFEQTRGGLYLRYGASFENAGTLAAESGSLLDGGGAATTLSNTGSVEKTGSGEYRLGTDHFDNSGAIQVSAGILDLLPGTATHSGTIQIDDGRIDLGGYGDLRLGGLLRILFEPGFAPAGDTPCGWQLIRGVGSLQGAFDDFELPMLPGWGPDYYWTIDYGPDDVWLLLGDTSGGGELPGPAPGESVPVPASTLLLLAGLAGIGRLRRGRGRLMRPAGGCPDQPAERAG